MLLTGRFDQLTIQHWRTMSVEAAFKMNNDVDHLFYSQLSTSITELKNTLKSAFPDLIFHQLIGENERVQLMELAVQARCLSFNLQRGFVSCRLVVTTTSMKTEDASDPGLGTYSFGLDRISEMERTVLIGARTITKKLLDTFVI